MLERDDWAAVYMNLVSIPQLLSLRGYLPLSSLSGNLFGLTGLVWLAAGAPRQ